MVSGFTYVAVQYPRPGPGISTDIGKKGKKEKKRKNRRRRKAQQEKATRNNTNMKANKNGQWWKT